MHVSVTRVATGDLPIETATIVAQEMMRWFRESDGFEGLVFLSRAGTTLALSFWENQVSPQVLNDPRSANISS